MQRFFVGWKRMLVMFPLGAATVCMCWFDCIQEMKKRERIGKRRIRGSLVNI